MAGGQSRRFGSPKALALWNGKTFVEHAISALAADSTVIISPLPQLDSFGRRVPDLPAYAGMGPLAGILTGMTECEADWYIVMPCDTPRMTRDVIERLLTFAGGMQAVVPVIEGRQQPLIAAYHCSTKAVLEQQLQQGELRMMSFLSRLSVRYVTEADLQAQPEQFMNVNTRIEYTELLNKESAL